MSITFEWMDGFSKFKNAEIAEICYRRIKNLSRRGQFISWYYLKKYNVIKIIIHKILIVFFMF